MTIQVVRYRAEHGARWGVHEGGRVVELDGDWPTTGAFLTDGGVDRARERSTEDVGDEALRFDDLELLSPVTPDGDLICLGMNYASHLRELGRDPKDARHNILFHKASSSLSGARTDVIRPAHVQALDYEVELGLVIGRRIDGPIDLAEEGLHDVVGALVVTNGHLRSRRPALPRTVLQGQVLSHVRPDGPLPDVGRAGGAATMARARAESVRQRGASAAGAGRRNGPRTGRDREGALGDPGSRAGRPHRDRNALGVALKGPFEARGTLRHAALTGAPRRDHRSSSGRGPGLPQAGRRDPLLDRHAGRRHRSRHPGDPRRRSDVGPTPADLKAHRRASRCRPDRYGARRRAPRGRSASSSARPGS